MFNLCLSCLRGEFILFNHCMCDLEDCMLTYFWRPVRFSFINLHIVAMSFVDASC